MGGWKRVETDVGSDTKGVMWRLWSQSNVLDTALLNVRYRQACSSIGSIRDNNPTTFHNRFGSSRCQQHTWYASSNAPLQGPQFLPSHPNQYEPKPNLTQHLPPVSTPLPQLRPPSWPPILPHSSRSACPVQPGHRQHAGVHQSPTWKMEGVGYNSDDFELGNWPLPSFSLIRT
jgi:hypothetical protein